MNTLRDVVTLTFDLLTLESRDHPYRVIHFLIYLIQATLPGPQNSHTHR